MKERGGGGGERRSRRRRLPRGVSTVCVDTPPGKGGVSTQAARKVGLHAGEDFP